MSEESIPLLQGHTASVSSRNDASSSNNSSSSSVGGTKEQERRDKCIFDAFQGLRYIMLSVSWTILITLLLIFVDEFTNDFPIWSYFLVIWLSQLMLVFVITKIIREIIRSLTYKGKDKQREVRWNDANGRRIPLMQYLIFQLVKIICTLFIAIIFEILLILYLYGVIESSWICIVPLIIFTMVAGLIVVYNYYIHRCYI